MSIAVTVTKYRAKDGSLHDSASEANAYNAWHTERDYYISVASVIEHHIANAIVREISDAWREIEDFQRDIVMQRIIETIIKHREELVDVLVNPSGS